VSDGGNLQGWRSSCTCPVGRLCKHGAALGIQAAMQGLTMRDTPGSADAAEDTAQHALAREEKPCSNPNTSCASGSAA
jgi:uncharacterized Zn finger protein